MHTPVIFKALMMFISCLSQVLASSIFRNYFWQYLFFMSLYSSRCLISRLLNLNSSPDVMKFSIQIVDLHINMRLWSNFLFQHRNSPSSWWTTMSSVYPSLHCYAWSYISVSVLYFVYCLNNYINTAGGLHTAGRQVSVILVYADVTRPLTHMKYRSSGRAI
jgi:hypothetical protein